MTARVWRGGSARRGALLAAALAGGGCGGTGSAMPASGAPGSAGGGAPYVATVEATGSAGGSAAAGSLPAPPVSPHLEVALVWSVGGSSRLYLCESVPPRCRPASAEEKDPPAGDASLAWSPDGVTVVFGTAELLRFVDGASGTLRTVAPGRRAGYAPDGRVLAVIDRGGVSLLDPGLANRKTLARSSADHTMPDDVARYESVLAWSPDGRRLAVRVAYYEGSGVQVLSVLGGAPLVETAHSGAAWSSSPDHLFVAAFDKAAGFDDDGLWDVSLAAPAPRKGAAASSRRLGEAGNGLLIAPAETLVLGYAEAGSFTRAPELWRPRGVLAARLFPRKRAPPELRYRRVVAAAGRAVPLGLSSDGRVLLYGVGGASDMYEAIRWADLATGESGAVTVPPGGGRVLAAALRPDPALAAERSAAAVDAAWARGTPLETRDGELLLAGAPPPESAPIVKPLPIPWWPTSMPASMPAGAGGTGTPASGAPAAVHGSGAPPAAAPAPPTPPASP
jgi:hypothetical protein